MGRKHQFAMGRHRAGLPETDLVQKLCVELFRQGVEPVHDLIKHSAEQFSQRRAGIVLCVLITPFRGIAAGQGGYLGADGIQVPRVENRVFHAPPPPSDPSVR